MVKFDVNLDIIYRISVQFILSPSMEVIVLKCTEVAVVSPSMEVIGLKCTEVEVAAAASTVGVVDIPKALAQSLQQYYKSLAKMHQGFQ